MPIVTPGSGGRDMRAELLPPELLPLFDDRFVRSCDLIEEYVVALARRVRIEAGLDRAAPPSLSPASGPLVDWLDRLAAAHPGSGRTPEEIAAEQQAHDPSALPSYRIAEVAASLWPAVMRGEIRGDDSLFSPEHAALWPAYFSNDNPLYAINNLVGARAARRRLPPGRLRILEVGGGLASGALALLDEIEATGRLDDVTRYHFTELATPFLRRGQRALHARRAGLPLIFGRVDVDAPLSAQGIEPGSVDLLWAVNTVHVAKDLAATLSGLRDALRPGGLLLLGECLRPHPAVPVYPEFVFLLLDAFRGPGLDPAQRREPGFLTPEEWERSLSAAGFTGIECYPDVARIREIYPAFFVGAVGAIRP